MRFELDDAFAILARTPTVLDAWLRGLPEVWIHAREGADTWSAFDVVGHLIHGEKADWIPRLRIILADGESRAFEPFDRFAQERDSAGKTLDDLLDEFALRRRESLAVLRELGLGAGELDRRGRHPALGPVSARQLLATWVAHDLSHLRQVGRVLAKQYADEVGPWSEYLTVMQE